MNSLNSLMFLIFINILLLICDPVYSNLGHKVECHSVALCFVLYFLSVIIQWPG